MHQSGPSPITFEGPELPVSVRESPVYAYKFDKYLNIGSREGIQAIFGRHNIVTLFDLENEGHKNLINLLTFHNDVNIQISYETAY